MYFNLSYMTFLKCINYTCLFYVCSESNSIELSRWVKQSIVDLPKSLYSKYVYICHRVTNCPLFYSDKEEIVEIPPPDKLEVVEVAPPPPQCRRKRGRWYPAQEWVVRHLFQDFIACGEELLGSNYNLSFFVASSSRSGLGETKVRCVYGQCLPSEEQGQCWWGHWGCPGEVKGSMNGELAAMVTNVLKHWQY